MDQHGPQVFWINMMGQRSEPEAAGGPQGCPTQTPLPPCSHESDRLLDGEKIRAMLLFSGVALVVLGVTFTFMGWRYHQTNPAFEWLKLLGPVLISVGVAFVLTSICKCTDFSYSRERGNEDVFVMSATGQTSRGRCWDQPVMIHSVTAIFGASPEYGFTTQEGRQGVCFQPRSPVCSICADPPPPHGSMCCVEAGSHDRGNRSQKPERETGCGDRNDSTGSRPPAYEDICPSFNSNLP